MNEKEQPKKVMSVYLPPALITRVRKHVKANCGNLSWFVEKVITDALDNLINLDLDDGK